MSDLLLTSPQSTIICERVLFMVKGTRVQYFRMKYCEKFYVNYLNITISTVTRTM